jgi:hypothetical protein
MNDRMDNVPNTNTSFVFPRIKVLGTSDLNGIQINGKNGTSGYVLTATGVGSGTIWAPPSSAGASQWTGATGSPIYYVPNVGIGSATTPTAKLQVLGNVYASNALTAPSLLVQNEVLSGFLGTTTSYMTGNLYVSNAITTSYVYGQSEVLTGMAGVTTLYVTGNVYASNALVAPSIYATTSIVGGTLVGSTQTLSGTAGMTSLNITGNVYVSNALTTTNVYAVRYYGDGGFLSNVNASGIVVAVKKVTSSYSVQLGDYYIGVNGTGIVITLPLGSSVATGKTYVIKDESGLVTPNSAYRFTIQGSGADLIDTSQNITVTVSFISLTFLWNGTGWSII